MTHGKNICNELKGIRRRIAEENGIPLKVEECTYAGPCRGTCPRCEAEVRYLENALADRLRLGKVATVAGLALGLASTTMQAQNTIPDTNTDSPADSTHQTVSQGTLKGRVFDRKTNEPLPIVQVMLMKDNVIVSHAVTDLDGRYTIKSIPAGYYDIKVSPLTHKDILQAGVYVKPHGFTVCDISCTNPDSTIIISSPVVEHVDFPVTGEVQVQLPGTPASQSGSQQERPRMNIDFMQLQDLNQQGAQATTRRPQ